MKIHKKALHFGLTLLPVGILCSIYLAMANVNAMKQAGMQAPTLLLIFASMIQIAFIYTLVLSYLGYLIAERTGLLKPFAFTKQETLFTVLVGLGCALVMISDYYLFAPRIAQVQAAYTKESFTLISLLFSMLYGGIIEEIMLRFFMLSLLVLILDMMRGKNRGVTPIPGWFHLLANLIAAVLFALGHLPATKMAFGEITLLLLARTLLLNGVLGFVFGLLYCKKGLQYAMLAHALTHLFNQAIFRFIIL
ncbi:MAG: CPBP family intramembrane metalloprotease [Spirochaetales bacterium]|nr:CPBP family intramembrane metalloprotease [Spirochaetales bacterium]